MIWTRMNLDQTRLVFDRCESTACIEFNKTCPNCAGLGFATLQCDELRCIALPCIGLHHTLLR